MTELEALSQRIKSSFRDAVVEIDGPVLYVEIHESQYQVMLENGVYSFRKEPSGFEESLEAELTTADEVMELITAPPPGFPSEKVGKTRLFNEYEAFTEEASAIAVEIEEAIKPIIKKHAASHPMRDIEVVVTSAAGSIMSECIIRAALEMDEADRKADPP